MKIKTIMKIYIGCLIAVVAACLLGASVSVVWPDVGTALNKIPIWIAGLFGAGFTAFGAIMITVWKQEKDADETTEKTASILAYEIDDYSFRLEQIVDTIIKNTPEYFSLTDPRKKMDRMDEMSENIDSIIFIDFFDRYRFNILSFDTKDTKQILVYFTICEAIQRFWKTKNKIDLLSTKAELFFFLDSIKRSDKIFLSTYKALQKYDKNLSDIDRSIGKKIDQFVASDFA